MKHRFVLLVVAAFVLVTAEPASAGGTGPTGGCGSHCGGIAEALGIRYERPVENLRVGQSVNATVLNAAKLSPYGISARNSDKVVLTLTGKNTFTVQHGGASGRTAKFSFDAQGALTPVH